MFLSGTLSDTLSPSARPMARRALARVLAGHVVIGMTLGGVACGGGGGSSTGETLRGVVLVDFLQAGQDNVPLNRTLEFRFSGPIDPRSVNPDSIQVRSGALFGSQVFGTYIIEGSTVRFEPKLASLCDLSDGGFQPDIDYRVTLVGSPEGFAIRDLAGDPLQSTINALFHTRRITDPQLFEDQVPGTAPTLVASSPVDEAYPQAPFAISADVQVQQGNRVVLTFSENVNPCTVSENTVLFHQYATGDLTFGFVPHADQTPSTPTTWGSGNATTPARRVRATFSLSQDQLTTKLILTPVFGEFPDNALLVVQVTNNVQDFGGNAMVPKAISFVTENRPLQVSRRTFDFATDFPSDPNVSTGDVNSLRSPGRAQGWLLFAGDGDNGTNLLSLTGPTSASGPVGCTSAGSQANDGSPDDFDPTADVTLHTGATRNTCRNSTDGSTAVVFEFRTFRIRNGVTVRIVGVNAAILLVSGDIHIEATGRLLARGDNSGGAPNSAGTSGVVTTTAPPAGGSGVAGGGDGGTASTGTVVSPAIYGQNGTAGLGSIDAYLTPGVGGSASPTRQGQGRGSVGQFVGNANLGQANRMAPGAGGGGHATPGGTGTNLIGAGALAPTLMDAFVDGVGGTTTGDPTGRMRTAETGSGGGGGGPAVWASQNVAGTGGSGGAGGGFVDLTSSSNITILGTVDAAGSRGGPLSATIISGPAFAFYGGGGGGGGGSGGGIRILSPKHVTLGPTTVLTTAGGLGGSTPFLAGFNVANPGGAGGLGRIAIEDSDSVIAGIGSATLIPGEGAPAGFYRGPFDATRFQGGGLQPVVISSLIDTGPVSPQFIAPDQTYAGTPVAAPGTPRVDFAAGIPLIASRGVGKTGILLEVQGFAALPDGTASSVGTGWRAIGYFKDSGAETFPTWTLGLPPPADVPAPSDSAGIGFGALNGRQFVQFRITFYLKSGMGPFDAGPYLDRWDFYYSYDQ